MSEFRGTKPRKTKPVNAVEIGTEAAVIAAPSDTTKQWVVHEAYLSADEAGAIFFQAGSTTTDLFVVFLEQNKACVHFTFGDGVPVGAGATLTADGATNATLHGYFVVTEE